jgi:AAA15 family ATPase/GTPase
MRIKRVWIQGFRSLRNVEIPFDDITTFIGPNGVGKSSVLRALNWFFHGSRDEVLISFSPEPTHHPARPRQALMRSSPAPSRQN